MTIVSPVGITKSSALSVLQYNKCIRTTHKYSYVIICFDKQRRINKCSQDTVLGKAGWSGGMGRSTEVWTSDRAWKEDKYNASIMTTVEMDKAL